MALGTLEAGVRQVQIYTFVSLTHARFFQRHPHRFRSLEDIPFAR